jgi:hypothetical protein
VVVVDAVVEVVDTVVVVVEATIVVIDRAVIDVGASVEVTRSCVEEVVSLLDVTCALMSSTEHPVTVASITPSAHTISIDSQCRQNPSTLHRFMPVLSGAFGPV